MPRPIRPTLSFVIALIMAVVSGGCGTTPPVPPDARVPVALLDDSIDGSTMQWVLRSQMPDVSPVVQEREERVTTTFTNADAGLRLRFSGDDASSQRLLLVTAYPDPSHSTTPSGMSPYRGPLPFGVEAADTRGDVEAKLGRPDRRAGSAGRGLVSYDRLGLHIWYREPYGEVGPDDPILELSVSRRPTESLTSRHGPERPANVLTGRRVVDDPAAGEAIENPSNGGTPLYVSRDTLLAPDDFTDLRLTRLSEKFLNRPPTPTRWQASFGLSYDAFLRLQEEVAANPDVRLAVLLDEDLVGVTALEEMEFGRLIVDLWGVPTSGAGSNDLPGRLRAAVPPAGAAAERRAE